MLTFIFSAIIVIACVIGVWFLSFKKLSFKKDQSARSPIAAKPMTIASFLDDVPEKVRDKVALKDGVLHISEDVIGELDVEFLISRLRSRRNITSHEFHKPSEFEERFARSTIRRVSGDNEVQQMCIQLIARAHKEGATDIHLINNGAFVQIKFRRKGAVCEDSEIGLALGVRMIRVIFDKLGKSANGLNFSTSERLDGRIVDKTFLPEGMHSVRIHCEPIECAQTSSGTFMALRLLFDSTDASSFLDELPENVRDKVVLKDSILYISEEIADIDIESLVSRLSAYRYVSSFEVKNAEEFKGLYDSTASGMKSMSVLQRMTVLGFPEEQRNALDDLTRRKGIIWVSGPTGHGKSTALKHIMEGMALFMPDKNILSAEDPPEYVIRGVLQVPVTLKQATGAYGTIQERAEAYAETIGGLMRSDLDVGMIGEVRFAEAALGAIILAQTGHAVWATIHASSAFGIVDRLETMLRTAGMRDPLSMLCSSNVLAGLEYQCLVPTLCPHCKRPLMDFWNDPEKLNLVMPPSVVSSLRKCTSFTSGNAFKGIFVRGDGCELCDNDGFSRKQVVVAEVVKLDTELLGILRAGNTGKAIEFWKNHRNGVTYVEQARRLIAAGELDPARTASRLGVELDCDLYTDGGAL